LTHSGSLRIMRRCRLPSATVGVFRLRLETASRNNLPNWNRTHAAIASPSSRRSWACLRLPTRSRRACVLWLTWTWVGRWLQGAGSSSTTRSRLRTYFPIPRVAGSGFIQGCPKFFSMACIRWVGIRCFRCWVQQPEWARSPCNFGALARSRRCWLCSQCLWSRHAQRRVRKCLPRFSLPRS